MNIKLIRYLSVALLLLAFTGMAFAKGEGERRNARLGKTLGEPVYTKININNISTWIKNDGETDIDRSGNSGLVYPKGTGRTAVFQSGFLWGGRIDGEFRVGGSVYRQGTVPGRIISPGVAADPNDPDVRIYRVRRDWEAGSLQAEVADGEGSEADIREQYRKDWYEWPASQGAPYEDVDGDGMYDPEVDIPGVVGADQTVWFVANDLDQAQSLFMYGSLPMGIEQQVTTWGYKATGALGNMIFRKFLIINKNAQQKPFEEMYVSMWSDPDLGDAGDDYVGSDTTLSLGYCYNANATDAVYNPFPPPAVGFDFFQGPMVDGAPTDTAIFKGHYRPGKKNLPMTAFYFFINSDPIYTDPTQGNYERGTLGFYNLFRGRVSTSGQPFVDPNTNLPTMFTLAGDPVTGTGWIDGQLHPPGDRRLGMVSGPFTMAYGDTQEVVVAEIAAGASAGIDRLMAVDLLKDYSVAAQIAYDRLFDLPRPPALPKTTIAALDQEVILSWGDDEAAVKLTEGYENFGYEFQGYNVYQFDQASNEVRRIATFDIVDDVKKVVDLDFDPVAGIPIDKVVAFGDDTGIRRVLRVKTDAFKSGLPLLNGSRYYFAVTAYAYNPEPPFGPKILENPIQTMLVVPQSPNPGVRYPSSYGDEIQVTHVGPSDGATEVFVVDPTKLNGNTYQVTFNDDGTWNLKNQTANKVLFSNVENQSGDENYPIADGMIVKVTGPSLGIKQVAEVDADNNIIDAAVGLVPFASLGPNGYIVHNRIGEINQPAFVHDEDRFDYWGMDDLILDFGMQSVSWEYINETINIDSETSQPTILPFGVIRKKFPSGELVRLFAGFYDVNGDGKWGATIEDVIWHRAAYEPIYAWQGYDAAGNEISYDPANDAQYIAENDLFTSANITWGGSTGEFVYPFVTGIVFVMYSATAKLPDPGRKVYYFTNKANSPVDTYTFTAPSVTVDPELAKEDVDKINVFPNPYYGVNAQELNKYQRFVTFSHLPQKATLRIFNLAGQLVRTISKDAPEQFLRWDLSNESQLPVASGLYIVHVDMPDLGKTKILKVAIIQEQQVLDRF